MFLRVMRKVRVGFSVFWAVFLLASLTGCPINDLLVGTGSSDSGSSDATSGGNGRADGSSEPVDAMQADDVGKGIEDATQPSPGEDATQSDGPTEDAAEASAEASAGD